MTRWRWGPLAVLVLAAAAVGPPVRAAVKVTPGQEFLYSGTVEWRVTGPDGSTQVISGPVKLSAVVSETEPAKGYSVILMRSVQPDPKPGQPNRPAEVTVSTLRYGADLKVTTPARGPGGPLTAVLQALAVPLTPHDDLKTGQEWRQNEPLPGLPIRPQEMVFTVAGDSKVGDRACLKIEKKLAQALPVKLALGGQTLEVSEFSQTLCVDPDAGVTLSHQLHQKASAGEGEHRAALEVNGSVSLQETRQLSTDELAARVKQAAAIDRVQSSLFAAQPVPDRKAALAQTAKDIAALRRDYPNSPYAPVLAQLDNVLGQIREQEEREARLNGLNGKPAPAFALKNLAGKEQALGAYRGKIILLNFFASW